MTLLAKLAELVRPRPEVKRPTPAAEPETRSRQIAELQRALGTANRAAVRDEALIARLGEQLERLL
jgi:hypothetical protein